jgi:hypothetical protein
MARLMSPDEVVRALQDRCKDDISRVGHRWMFCGDVSQTTFERMRTIVDQVKCRVSAFSTPLGGTYAVLTHQVEMRQHRFLAALYDPAVIRCVASLDREAHGFLLGNDEGSDALEFDGVATGEQLRPLRSLCVSAGAERMRDMLLELPVVVSALSAPYAIPSLDAPGDIEEVSLSVLMPDEVLRQVANDVGHVQ